MRKVIIHIANKRDESKNISNYTYHHIFSLTKKNLFNYIDEKKVKKEDIFLIDFNAHINDVQPQRAVYLLFFIRCKYELLNPIIVYGKEHLKEILIDYPDLLILLAPGVSYVQEKQLSSIEIMHFQPVDEHTLLAAYPNFIEQALKTINNHQFGNIWGLKKLGYAIGLLNNSNDIRYAVNVIVEKEIKHLGALEKDFVNANFLWNYQSETNDIEQIKKQFKHIQSSKNNNSNIQILLIDDKSNNGWAELMKIALFGNGFCSGKLDFIKEPDFNNLEILTTTVLAKIKNVKYDVILLDLRLNNEEGVHLLENLWGYKLLQLLKTTYYSASIPVYIVTASNNPYTISRLINAGAESVWLKESAKTNLTYKETLQNYIELLKLIKSILTQSTEKEFEAKLKQWKAYKKQNKLHYSKLGLEFDIIYFDTNFFLVNKKDSFTKLYKRLLALELLIKIKHGVVDIRYEVYSELHSKYENKAQNDKNLQLSAWVSLQFLNNYFESPKIIKNPVNVTEFEKVKKYFNLKSDSKFKLFDADLVFYSLIKKDIANGRNVLLITNDMGGNPTDANADWHKPMLAIENLAQSKQITKIPVYQFTAYFK